MSTPPAPPPPPPAGGEAPMSQSDERTWAMLAQLSGILLGFIGPLLVLLIFGPRSAFVKKESTEALNFQILVVIGYIVSFILTFIFIGILLFFAVAIVNIVFCVMAALKNKDGIEYRYPINLRLIK